MTDKSKIMKEGYLIKQGPPPWKTWKKRWCVLQPEGLTYYKDEKKREVRGTISIQIIDVVEKIPSSSKKKFCFKMNTAARGYVWAIQDEAARDHWMNCLKKAIEDYSSSKSLAAQLVKPSTTTTTTTTTTASPKESFVLSPPAIARSHSEKENAERLELAERQEQERQSSLKERELEQQRKKEEEERLEKERIENEKKAIEKAANDLKKEEEEKIVILQASEKEIPPQKEEQEKGDTPPSFAGLLQQTVGPSNMDGLSKESLEKLQEQIDRRMEDEIETLRQSYLKQLEDIVEELIERERDEVISKYDKERESILAEIKSRQKQEALIMSELNNAVQLNMDGSDFGTR